MIHISSPRISENLAAVCQAAAPRARERPGERFQLRVLIVGLNKISSSDTRDDCLSQKMRVALRLLE